MVTCLLPLSDPLKWPLLQPGYQFSNKGFNLGGASEAGFGSIRVYVNVPFL